MMVSRRAWLTIAVIAISVVIAAMIMNSRRTGGGDEEKVLLEEKRLIESLDGPALFQAYCAACHGEEGKGGGPAASVLLKAVPDLTRISQRNGGQFPSDRIQKIISGDGPGIAAHGSREMPIWGPIFRRIEWDQELSKLCINNLTKYLESLQQK